MTIYDIAKEAGVAASTVSRVINQRGGIKEETRKRVLAVLKQYNYIPNEAARGLVMQATKTIGVLIEDIRVEHHTGGIYCIEQYLTERGYCCILMSTGKDPQKKVDNLRILVQRRVEGAILIGSNFCNPTIQACIEHDLGNIPVVIVNGCLDLPNVYGVLVDEQNGVTSCVEMLVQNGRKHIGFVLNEQTPSSSRKQAGFEAGIRQAFGANAPALVFPLKNNQYNEGYFQTLEIMKLHPELDALIYSIDLVAVGGICALSDTGVAVPDRVAVVGVDNSYYCEMCRPRLTSLDNCVRESSREAARILLEALGGQEPPHKIHLFSTIVHRESTCAHEI